VIITAHIKVVVTIVPITGIVAVTIALVTGTVAVTIVPATGTVVVTIAPATGMVVATIALVTDTVMATIGMDTDIAGIIAITDIAMDRITTRIVVTGSISEMVNTDFRYTIGIESGQV